VLLYPRVAFFLTHAAAPSGAHPAAAAPPRGQCPPPLLPPLRLSARPQLLVAAASPLQYEEALELAAYGSRLFHERTMLPLMETGACAAGWRCVWLCVCVCAHVHASSVRAYVRTHVRVCVFLFRCAETAVCLCALCACV
jgi:hypothetical protein